MREAENEKLKMISKQLVVLIRVYLIPELKQGMHAVVIFIWHRLLMNQVHKTKIKNQKS
jgi:hypothetical protein